MQKDIIIPKVTDVSLAIVLDTNDKDGSEEWGVYLINNKNVPLEMVVIVSQGFSETKKTSLFRRKIDVLPAKSFSKFEVMPEELFTLDNRFQVTFFLDDNKLYDKTYIFQAETIQKGFLKHIPILGKQGVIIN